jgi:hypothetical protein
MQYGDQFSMTRINQLLKEAITLMLVEFDLKTQFEIRAICGRGNEQRGLDLLEKAKG